LLKLIFGLKIAKLSFRVRLTLFRNREKRKMRKIIVVGATGTIGKAVSDLLARDHQVIRVGKNNGNLNVDLRLKASIEKLFKKCGPVDGVVCTAGHVRFGRINEVTNEDFIFGINNKVLSQVNLVRTAIRHIKPKGFITLTTGMLARQPLPSTVPAAMANAALEGFVRAVALDLEKGIRINAVSPIFINITARKMGLTDICTMNKAETAKAYLASVEGDMNGQVLDVRDYGDVECRQLETADWWGLLNTA
jgi:NAD(P)-dependent dehydrogenase (short-subunit alcohol dehydrogenase family)